ncbi:MAG TPA: sulfatase-like hydrolase/transferase, partial [Fibrobacteria bacterium]|nr:sulfatase-like hydrolase/transferase [Fibrobacteria bacterium]
MKISGGRFWFVWGALLWSGRVLLLLWLYFAPAPGGGPLVENWTRFLPHSLVAEAGPIAVLALLGMLIDGVLTTRRRWTLHWLATLLGILYLVAAHFDAELMRWMSQHLTLSWIDTYLRGSMDSSFIIRILGGSPKVFFLGFAITALVSLVLVLWTRRGAYSNSPRFTAIVVALAIAATGLSSKWWFGKSAMRWRRIHPVAWGLGGDLAYRFLHTLPPRDYEDGIKWLAASGHPGATPVPGRYPFWRVEPAEDSLMAAFRARPEAERPDVVLLVIETLRGWAVDLRDPAACANIPRLCGLAREGVFFPHAQSGGYPSIEGFTSTQLGIWAHPGMSLLVDHPGTHVRALPQIMGRAGYYRAALTASDPGFDNITPWFSRWYDFWEYDANRNADHLIADRFAKLLGEVPAGKPLFALWMSTTTHTPYKLPPGYGPNPDNPADRYRRVLAYMDSSVGIVLDAIRNGPRHRPTIVIVVGDHAIANPPLFRASDRDGIPGQGQTWTALWMSGPGIPRGEVRPRPVSQVDIAPTVMSLLRLRASNHFMGIPLLAAPSSGDSLAATSCTAGPRELAFRLEGMTSQRGACRFTLRFDDAGFLRAFRQDLYAPPLADRVDG